MKISSSSFVAAAVLASATFSINAQAAFSQASAEFTGFADIRVTGTADYTFTEFDLFSAIGTATSGVTEFGSDGEFFDSMMSLDGEGTATNTGFGEIASSYSFTEASNTSDSAATTLAELEIEFEGVGTVEFDIAYDLFVDTFDTQTLDTAFAQLFAYGTSVDEVSAELEVFGSAFGDDDSATDILTIVFDVDDLGFGAYTEYLTIGTEAVATSTVPVPAAAWLFGSALIGLMTARRK